MKVKKLTKYEKKQKKYGHKRVLLQFAMVCALVCSVVQWIPERVSASSGTYALQRIGCVNDIYANRKYTTTYNLVGDTDARAFCVVNSKCTSFKFFIVSKSSFKISWSLFEDGTENISTGTSDLTGSLIVSGDKYYYYSWGATSRPYWDFKLPGAEYTIISDESHTDDEYINSFMTRQSIDGTTITMSTDTADIMVEATKGQIDNPIEDDEEIGIPVITKRRYTTVYHDTDTGNASDGKEDIDDSQFIFDWSNKTSTGFNLKKNKYHMTRIQIKVQSKCVVYSGFSHKTVKKRFDNYGEMSSDIKSVLVDDTPYSIEYGTVKSMLPKTFSEKHNPLYVGRNFTFYFRVMCNESASGTGKWHCGAWRAVGLNASTTQDQTDESSNGHIDSDGNYTKDPDDGHNNSDSDSSTVDDKEDAKDQFKDDQKNGVTNGKNDSSGFEWSDLKKLVNECKEVPTLIKSIFSFLPDWVLVFVAVGFGIWIFVLIKRAIV